MLTNEEMNADRERLRQQANRDAADKNRVIPDSGRDSRTIEHTIYTEAYQAASKK